VRLPTRRAALRQLVQRFDVAVTASALDDVCLAQLERSAS
jgi:hypothetical protein